LDLSGNADKSKPSTRRTAKNALESGRPTGMTETSTATDIVVPLDSDELSRAERAPSVSTIVAGAFLIVSALPRLGQTTSRLPIILVVFGTAAMAAGIFEVLRRKKLGRRVRWIDLLAAVLLALEGVELVANGKRPGYLYFVAAIMTALVGLFGHRLGARRLLRITDDDLSVRLNRFRGFTVRWDEIQSATIGPEMIVIRTRDRVRRLTRSSVGNWSAVSSVLHERLNALHLLGEA
jgi:hypothetical protein